jgi:hypothetical protein
VTGGVDRELDIKFVVTTPPSNDSSERFPTRVTNDEIRESTRTRITEKDRGSFHLPFGANLVQPASFMTPQVKPAPKDRMVHHRIDVHFSPFRNE